MKQQAAHGIIQRLYCKTCGWGWCSWILACGDGFFSILAAKKVGEKWEVYAVDSDASAIERLNCKTEGEGLKNIFGKIGLAEEIVFCQY